MLLNAAKCQGYILYRFWPFLTPQPPTPPPTQIRVRCLMGFLIHLWVWYEKAHPEWSKIVTYASLLVCCWGRSGFFIKNFEHILNDLFFSVNFVYLFTSVAFLLLGVSTIFVIANANTVDGRNLLKGAMSYVVCRFSSLIVWSSPKFFLLLTSGIPVDKYFFKITNKDTETSFLTLFWCLYCWLLLRSICPQGWFTFPSLSFI